MNTEENTMSSECSHYEAVQRSRRPADAHLVYVYNSSTTKEAPGVGKSLPSLAGTVLATLPRSAASTDIQTKVFMLRIVLFK